MINKCIFLLAGLLVTVASARVDGDEATRKSLEAGFVRDVAPLVKVHCLGCHGSQDPEAKLDLSMFQSMRDVAQSHATWANVLDRLDLGEMPPEDADNALSDRARKTIVKWIREVRDYEAERTAGDPGPVLARRLSGAEYDYTIRDLTGVDIRPTKTFPVDPANEAGFDNSGESLAMSPALMTKYLGAARTVADHLVLTPKGIRFSPHPVVTDTDRDKYCVKRIVAFYLQQPTDYSDYFRAAWLHRRAARQGASQASLEEVARDCRVSLKYLSLVWEFLEQEEDEPALGPLGRLRSMWNALPDDGTEAEIREACDNMRDYVIRARKQFEPHFANLHIEGVHKGSQPFVLWKNDQYASKRREADVSFLAKSQSDQEKDALPKLFDLPSEAQQDRFEKDCRRFCNVFPDAFYVSERGRDYLDKPREQQEKGRLLSAGFHSMMGYYRDDQPLQDLVLDNAGRERLDELWRELDFITAAPLRQYQGFLWFERTDSRYMRDPQFDFARPEDKQALEKGMIASLAKVYLEKAENSGGREVPLQAIRDYFFKINKQIRWVEQARRDAEPAQLDAVVDFASLAYRRPLAVAEQAELRDFYRSLREADSLSHEEAIQDLVVSILMSPRFCYRVDLLSDTDQPRPLDDFELASRLSYFIWASGPDAELRRVAATGELRRPEVLKAQAHRMLRDPRVRGLAKEFVGNWLDFRRFEEHNSVDRNRFPTFDDALRSAMFEEPVRFFMDVAQRDRSILDLLYGDHTFVNSILAKHYGMPVVESDRGWREVENADAFDRGGLLPMAVFLTKNSPGLRTSPVKRGYWVVRRLLGERIPPPPPDVPELPSDESMLGEQTLRETLAKHREHPSCAGCHNRFDSVGLVFEGFGPIGERRQRDLGDRPIDRRAEFPDGARREGLAGLKTYIRERREEEFIDNFGRKLLAYALGRSLLLSDELLLRKLRSGRIDGPSAPRVYDLSHFVEAIVTSPQFLNKRGRNFMDGEGGSTGSVGEEK